MKKNSISRFTVIIITALFLLTTANSFAGKHIQPVKTAAKQTKKNKAACIAYVQINFCGTADTPYLSFNAQAAVVYAQIENALSPQPGLFHVLITFVNKDGEIVDEDDYYIDNHNYADAIKYD